MKQYVFKCFQTKGGNYVYDRSTNSLISVTVDEYDEMKKLCDGELEPGLCKTLSRYQEHGMFLENSGAVDKPYPIFKLRDKIEEKTGWDGYADTDRR